MTTSSIADRDFAAEPFLLDEACRFAGDDEIGPEPPRIDRDLRQTRTQPGDRCFAQKMQRRAVAMHDAIRLLGLDFDVDGRTPRRGSAPSDGSSARIVRPSGKRIDNHAILGRGGEAEQAVDPAKAFRRLAAAEPALAILEREIAIADRTMRIDGEATQRLAAHRFYRIAPKLGYATENCPPSTFPPTFPPPTP